MKKLKLISKFLDMVELINRRIIKYSVMSLKSTLKHEAIKLNNSTLYEDDDTPVIVGTFEVEYYIEFWKKLRSSLFRNFFQNNGKFCLAIDGTQNGALAEKLIEHELAECEVEYNKEYSGSIVLYFFN